MNNNLLCRNTQYEIDRDVAHRLDQEQGLTPSAVEVMCDRLHELMHKDCTDADMMIVLSESERFVNAFKGLLPPNVTDDDIAELMLDDGVQWGLRQLFDTRYHHIQDNVKIVAKADMLIHDCVCLPTDSREPITVLEAAKNLNSVAETVLREWLELTS